MGEFFIVAKFQGHGIGKKVAKQIWNMHTGNWEVSVIPENKPAFAFWKKIINKYTNGNYRCETKIIDYDKYQPERIIFNLLINQVKK